MVGFEDCNAYGDLGGMKRRKGRSYRGRHRRQVFQGVVVGNGIFFVLERAGERAGEKVEI